MYYCMIVKKNFALKKEKDNEIYRKFFKGEMYICSNEAKEKLYDLIPEKPCQFIDIQKFFKSYNHEEKGTFTKLIIRYGGIGDLVALSSICNQLTGKVLFVSQQKYSPVLQLYENTPELIHYEEPIFKNVDFRKQIELKKQVRLCDFGSLVENGSNKNWFEIFYNQLNIKSNIYRPNLTKRYNQQNYLLICPKSSASFRTIQFETIYNALKQTELFSKYWPICVNNADLSTNDRNFIENNGKNIINIITTASIREYLESVEKAGLVISVDTGSLHLREGWQLPAIGLYNSFTAECRTSGYKFTKSFNIKSACEKQVPKDS